MQKKQSPRGFLHFITMEDTAVVGYMGENIPVQAYPLSADTEGIYYMEHGTVKTYVPKHLQLGLINR